jgi:P-type Ca2+ transporter type 2C
MWPRRAAKTLSVHDQRYSKRLGYAITVKGAPDMVLELCTHYQKMNDEPRPLDERSRQRILAANDEMTTGALRVLGVAYRVEKDIPDNHEQYVEELRRTWSSLA